MDIKFENAFIDDICWKLFNANMNIYEDHNRNYHEIDWYYRVNSFNVNYDDIIYEQDKIIIPIEFSLDADDWRTRDEDDDDIAVEINANVKLYLEFNYEDKTKITKFNLNCRSANHYINDEDFKSYFINDFDQLICHYNIIEEYNKWKKE